MECNHEMVVEYYDDYPGHKMPTGYEYCKKCHQTLDDIYADEIEEIVNAPVYQFDI